MPSKNGMDTGVTYRRIELCWSSVKNDGEEEEPLHECSQPFVRPLLGGRTGTFRLHRFTIASHASLDEQLVALALRQREDGPGLQLSNVGGFHSPQNLFEEPDAEPLRELCASCVRSAAAAVCAEAGAPAPSEGSEPCGWSNVSFPGGDLNQLHAHPSVTLASCYYAQVSSKQASLDGSLLVRLTPARGMSQAEPDEERHVPWLGNPTGQPNAQSCSGIEDGEVLYAEIQPTAGVLVVFPAWLSHAVAPTRQQAAKPRVSFAANWDFQTPADDYPEGWRWWR